MVKESLKRKREVSEKEKEKQELKRQVQWLNITQIFRSIYSTKLPQAKQEEVNAIKQQMNKLQEEKAMQAEAR